MAVAASIVALNVAAFNNFILFAPNRFFENHALNSLAALLLATSLKNRLAFPNMLLCTMKVELTDNHVACDCYPATESLFP